MTDDEDTRASRGRPDMGLVPAKSPGSEMNDQRTLAHTGAAHETTERIGQPTRGGRSSVVLVRIGRPPSSGRITRRVEPVRRVSRRRPAIGSGRSGSGEGMARGKGRDLEQEAPVQGGGEDSRGGTPVNAPASIRAAKWAPPAAGSCPPRPHAACAEDGRSEPSPSSRRRNAMRRVGLCRVVRSIPPRSLFGQEKLRRSGRGQGQGHPSDLLIDSTLDPRHGQAVS